MADYRFIKRQISGGLATITLCRPDVMNAVSPDMADELRHALDGLSRDGARCLLLTGEGRAFCAGANLGDKNLTDGAPGDQTRRDLQQHYNPVIAALNGLDIPIVTAVNGAAAGIGSSIALSGDIIVAGKSAYFLQAFVNIGLVPDGGATWLLPKLVGVPRAMAMMMLGERLPAEEAEKIGLITYCVDDDQLLAKAVAIATRLAEGPTLALAMTRQMVRSSLNASLPDALAKEAESQRLALESQDAMEGIGAFMMKRKAAFQGK